MFGKKKDEQKCLEFPKVRGILEANAFMDAIDRMKLILDSQDYIADVQAQRIPRPSEDEYREFVDSVKDLCKESDFDFDVDIGSDAKAYINGLGDALHWIFGEEIYGLNSNREGD